MKHQLALAAILLSCATSAFAQRGNGNNNNRNNNQNQNNGNNNNRNGQNRGGGTLPLPEGVNSLVSVDAYNILLAESKDDDNQSILTPIVVRHVYSGGIAALFGGSSIPTAQFVSPGAQNMGNGGNGGVGGGQFGGGGFGVGGFGGNQGNQGFGNQGNQGFGNQGNTGFGNQGFGNQGFGNQGFGNQGVNGNFSMNPGANNVTGFNGTGFNNGFNAAGNGQIFRTPNGGIGTSQTSVLGPNGQQVPLANGPVFVR